MATLKITERPQVPALKNGASLLITQQEMVNGEPVESLRRIEANPLLAPPITSTATGRIVSITDGAARPAVEVISHIAPVQEGSGDASPNNVRPISGWNIVGAARAGKNLISETPDLVEDGFIEWTFNPPLPPGTYTVSAKVTTDDTDANNSLVSFYVKNGETVFTSFSRTGAMEARTVTIPKQLQGFRICASNGISLSAGDELTVEQLQLEIGTTATDYEPYNEETLTTPLSETVYGGKLNWTTGVLTNKYARIVFDGVTDGRKFNLSDSSTGESAYISKRYLPAEGKPGGLAYSNMTTSLRIANAGPIIVGLPPSLTGASASDDSATVTSKFNAACAALYAAGTPLEIVYEIATPEEIQLSPYQLSTLKGINNVWSSTGETTLSYIADTELWSKASQTSMIGAVEPGMVASKNYAAGDFIVDQAAMTLYRATAPIAKGEAIKPGTNCTATTVVEQLAALYSLINR